MKTKIFTGFVFLVVSIAVMAIFLKEKEAGSGYENVENNEKEEEGRKEAVPAGYFEARAMYDIQMLKDPATGKIPRGIFELENQFARTIPVKGEVQGSGGMTVQQTQVNNNYITAGPFNTLTDASYKSGNPISAATEFVE